jgi:hypothetical protein
MPSASHGLLGRLQRANDDSTRRFGPNTAEVEAFIQAVAHFSPWQWRQVLAAWRLVASVTKEDPGREPHSVSSIQEAIRRTDGSMPETMSRAGERLLESLDKRSDDKVVAAWQAASALVMRHHLSALKFAAHYAAFAPLIPLSAIDSLDPSSKRFVLTVETLSAEQCSLLAKPWRMDHEASRALQAAVAKSRFLKTEEAVAVAALRSVPTHLRGDAGWAAVRTVVHGGRVLARRQELTEDEVAILWSPLEAAIPLESVQEGAPAPGAGSRVRAAMTKAIKTMKPPRAAASTPAKAPGPFGPNSVEVAAFVKGVVALTAIQWLRVLDRRQLVASVTREGSAEPASVVRAILAAIAGTQSLEIGTRCRAFAAVERASFAVEAKARPGIEPALQYYAPFESLLPLADVRSASFARRLSDLSDHDWTQVASLVATVSEDAVAPLVNAGTSLIDFLRERTDDEAVATWHALSALVRRQHLTPIKFAASYAPFASAIPITNSRGRGAMVVRYVTSIGRLGSAQCELLARPWQLTDDLSNALSRAMADGIARPSEEAAALAAMVTVPMRLTGSPGWAAVKTAAFGGRVIASRARLTSHQLEALWKPIEPAIPLASLGTPAKSRSVK